MRQKTDHKLNKDNFFHSEPSLYDQSIYIKDQSSKSVKKREKLNEIDTKVI